MKAEEIKADIALMRTKLTELESKLAGGECDSIEPWKPNGLQSFFYIVSTGLIEQTHGTNHHLIKSGNCYPTREAAERALKFETAMRYALAVADKIGMTNGENYIPYSSDNSWRPNHAYSFFSPFRFKFASDCKRFIDTVGAERLNIIYRITD